MCSDRHPWLKGLVPDHDNGCQTKRHISNGASRRDGLASRQCRPSRSRYWRAQAGVGTPSPLSRTLGAARQGRLVGRSLQVLSRDDLPCSVPLEPRVGPDPTALLTVLSSPGLAALRDGHIAVEADDDVIDLVRYEILRAFRRVSDHLGLAVMLPIRVHADEVVGENAFHRSRVARGHRFRPPAFGVANIFERRWIVWAGGRAFR